MTPAKRGLWNRILRHLRGPTFEEILEESAEGLREKPIRMRCPACRQLVPLADRCPSCGSPRHPPVDQRA